MTALSIADPCLAHAQLARYALPLKDRWVTARGVWTHRQGWLLRLVTSDGRKGYGDCAPLPEAGTEDPATAQTWLRATAHDLIGRSPEQALQNLPTSPETPAARCALETALVDLVTQALDRPLAKWLSARAKAQVAVNASLGKLGDDTTQRAGRAISEGYRVLKVKIGLNPPEDECRQLRRLARELPSGTHLRLDANGAWTEPEATQAIQRLRDLPIESLEEPLSNPDRRTLKRLQALTPWSLAMDESLSGWSIDELLDDPPVRRLVLKPTVLGGLLPTLDLAALAGEAGLECVITSSVDSAAGLWGTVHLAAALGGNGVHGLATSDWLSEDIGQAPPITQARITVPDVPGLGFQPFRSLKFD